MPRAEKLAPVAVEPPTMISDWIRITTTLCATLAATSASRDTGETRKRSMIPRSIALIPPIPCQPADMIALMTTIPGVRKSRYDPPWKPGMSTTRLKSAPASHAGPPIPPTAAAC